MRFEETIEAIRSEARAEALREVVEELRDEQRLERPRAQRVLGRCIYLVETLDERKAFRLAHAHWYEAAP